MGFKADTSFLRFLTMGTVGVRQTMRQMTEAGFRPIELERYCGSNKIWATKVKRLRLPDVLCVNTGLRVEVRAKSDLKIRMSDAPNNPERRWDAGLRDDDLAAFIACFETETGYQPAEGAILFTVKALRDAVGLSTLGPPKSASEGAERDRTWPAVIPSRDGIVEASDFNRLTVMMQGDDRPPRRQSYSLSGKRVYVSPGGRFKAEASILAGVPESSADLAAYLARRYNPLHDLQSTNDVDRYAAAKALPYREDLRRQAVGALEDLLGRETEERVALEAAGAAATLGSLLGQTRINEVLWGQGRGDLRMEAVLILTELGSAFAREELGAIAADQGLSGNEIRQAAVWGLGKAGLKAYEDLVPFIADEDENVALHAIAAFGEDTPKAIIERLVQVLQTGEPRQAPAASEALRIIDSDDVLEALIEAAQTGSRVHGWVLVTLGRLSPALVQQRLAGTPLLERIAPMLLIAQGANWLSTETAVSDISFLRKQNLF